MVITDWLDAVDADGSEIPMPLKALSQIDDDEAFQYIQKYFEIKGNGRPRFTGSHFETFAGGGDTVEPNRITPADLLAVAMLSVHVRGQAALGISETLVSDIESLLQQIPVEAKLEDINGDDFEKWLGDQSPAQKVWELVTQKDDKWKVGPTTASKILARKRPHLIPIYDSVVREVILGESSGNYWRDWFQAFQGSEGQQQADRLRTIREKSGQQHLSLIRVLDIILWMKGSGYAKVPETVDDGVN